MDEKTSRPQISPKPIQDFFCWQTEYTIHTHSVHTRRLKTKAEVTSIVNTAQHRLL